MDESPPAMARCSLSREKSTAKTPRDKPVTVPEKEKRERKGEERRRETREREERWVRGERREERGGR